MKTPYVSNAPEENMKKSSLLAPLQCSNNHDFALDPIGYVALQRTIVPTIRRRASRVRRTLLHLFPNPSRDRYAPANPRTVNHLGYRRTRAGS
jgi:hypothetical protein